MPTERPPIDVEGSIHTQSSVQVLVPDGRSCTETIGRLSLLFILQPFTFSSGPYQTLPVSAPRIGRAVSRGTLFEGCEEQKPHVDIGSLSQMRHVCVIWTGDTGTGQRERQ